MSITHPAMTVSLEESLYLHMDQDRESDQHGTAGANLSLLESCSTKVWMLGCVDFGVVSIQGRLIPPS